ncbi:hypothetical protein SS1G_13583 [Sclerotinia sclerotiorum 1980 UF-70]|uniref:USP domain-containing protein n=1 Tax=Sclerotinia sclerotiorum (strain ATCC 18683 / 1980 / Ss-1) TaxID=665079 RepID=A7F7K3_SCLS1|nr:hypothetical protein SS1G_13583 [Sclerotinia sclerotiorum 1980 UF-70]EDN98724.1 hypothetical protein SS1G_13583 [Sclerotinia sclerotiorum 1980 UF-70]
MRPYKVEYLMNELGEVEEDMFELVGVLVHTGTAETGHYYSYIRERPQVGSQENWVEFNDDAVTSWEPGFMESACFGGLEHGTIDNLPFEKNYSAYMLFYQRSSTLIVANDELAKKENGVSPKAVVNPLQGSRINMKNKPVVRNPLKIAVEPRQANHITLENELVMLLLDSGFLMKAIDIICADTIDNDSQLTRMLQAISKRNLMQRPVSQPLWGPFLRAAILYCEHSENPKAIPDMAFHIAKNSFNLDNNDGSEYLRFFKDLVALRSNSNDISQEEITKIVLSTLTQWVPTLLTHHQSAVRSDTEDFLGELIFNIGVEEDDTSPENEQTLADHRRDQTRRLGNACLEYLQDVYIRQRVQAVRTVMINIEHVVGLCLQYFEPGPAADRYKLNMDNLWNHLRRYMVEEVDDGSAWENSDDEYASDEPMDNITELCEPMDIGVWLWTLGIGIGGGLGCSGWIGLGWNERS